MVSELAALRADTDMVWLIAAGALVFFMQAGFALLESGMSRSKNAINVIMKNYCDMCFGAIAFWAVGYGLMFGTNPSGWIGTDHFALHLVTEGQYGMLFFQMMFAATAATIVSGAIAERTKFAAYIVGSVVITGLTYPVFGAWAWGSMHGGTGWLKELGFIDFAGSTVVHSVGGWAALAAIIMVGPRLGRFDAKGVARPVLGHNLTSVALGGFILWLGWFGFNGGSVLSANPAATSLVLVNTCLAAAAGGDAGVAAAGGGAPRGSSVPQSRQKLKWWAFSRPQLGQLSMTSPREGVGGCAYRPRASRVNAGQERGDGCWVPNPLRPAGHGTGLVQAFPGWRV